ncbi:unnamed protein product [Dicrocoelium dendriticum]|nr:unnamed protein product [Dicrocoelium dendriticum]
MPAFVSMPNVNGSRSRQPSFEEECPKEGVTQGCKPPSAKRPRLNAVKQEAEARWIPTGYPTDTDGEWSSGTAMMDDNGSLMSDSAMPEMQDNPGAQSRATGCVPFIEYSPYKAPRPLSNMGVCTPTDPLVNNTFGGQNAYDMQNSTEGQSSESATYRSQSGASADDPYRSPRNDPRSWSDYSANSDKQSPANRFHEELNTESPSSKESFIAEQMQQISPTIRMLQTKATKSRPPSDVMVYEYEA